MLDDRPARYLRLEWLRRSDSSGDLAVKRPGNRRFFRIISGVASGSSRH
jgi:hypothetical protein